MAYRVTGAFVQVSSAGPTGAQKIALYQGAILPGDVPAEEIRHHLSVNMIEQVGDDEGPVGEPIDAVIPQGVVQPDPARPGGAGGPAEGTPPAALGGATPTDDPERVAARAELPEDGSPPKTTASKAVWVEYAVSKGGDYEACNAATKADLIDTYKS